jgi:nitroreductase
MKLNNAIQNRWSPRAFSEKEVTKEMIELLFEAARRAPSSMNEQPWKYYYVHRNNKEKFNEVVELLTGTNPLWAQHAQVLIISVIKKNFDYKNRPNGKALHDIGAANISIAIQAAEMGLQAHQMGGFDKEKAANYLQLETEYFEPVTVIAVGFPDDEKSHTEDYIKRKQQSETRKSQSEFVFEMKG